MSRGFTWGMNNDGVASPGSPSIPGPGPSSRDPRGRDMLNTTGYVAPAPRTSAIREKQFDPKIFAMDEAFHQNDLHRIQNK